ncbi:MAG: fused MFS/spermidine synthase [Flavipsychrobacter sp.]|nr:fused MFS/spermidine synthase [Flavipsychrobacter sp.]
MFRISLYQKLLSYFYPVQVAKAATPQNEVLDLLYYCNRFQLSTHDAMYSDGDKYRPLMIAFTHIGSALADMKDVLVLGTGLGSAANILYNKGYKPQYTFVEYDSTILQWAMKVLPKEVSDKSNPIHMDAAVYIETCGKQYNLLITDIFNSRVVPAFVTTEKFLKQCRRCIMPGGYFVLNYIVLQNTDWQAAEQVIRSVFPNITVLQNGINRIVVARV